MAVLAIDLTRLPPEARDALRDVLSSALEQLQAPAPAPAAPAEPAPVFLDPRGYADHIGVSEWKVRQLCQLGLPHTRVPGGRKLIRIQVALADAWMQAQGARL